MPLSFHMPLSKKKRKKRRATPKESGTGVGVEYGWRRQGVVQRWSCGNRGRETCWMSRPTVADGGAQESGRGLREGKPRVTAGHRGRQSMYRRDMEADEASPEEAELAVPSPTKHKRADALVRLHESSLRKR